MIFIFTKMHTAFFHGTQLLTIRTCKFFAVPGYGRYAQELNTYCITIDEHFSALTVRHWKSTVCSIFQLPKFYNH